MPSPAYNYSQNQFYGLSSFEPFSNIQERNAEDNPPFIWPPSSLKNAATGTTTAIQRGYLRLLAEFIDREKGPALSKRRLHFQFNPDVITRAVAARNDIQLWFNMDPAQMTQPIPGDANFAFELLFNREAEVYSAFNGYNTAREVRSGVAESPAFASNPVDPASFVYGYSVGDIGVLADLIVFDELIGQGVNKNLIEAMVKRAEEGAAYSLTQDAAEEDTADEEDKETTPTVFNEDSTRTALENNWGNSAFLISQPIRVVFSSLFMVEGYVNSTTVVFNKFTPTMVPVQATVGVQMQAMYMGFGRKNTFFTEAFKANEEEIATVNKKIEQETKALTSLGERLFLKVRGTGSTTDPRALMSVRELLKRIDVLSGADRDNLIETEKRLTLTGMEELKFEVNERKSIRSITPSAEVKVKYLGNSVPGNVPTDLTADAAEGWTLPVRFEKPLNLKDFGRGDPQDTISFYISTLPPQGVGYTLDESSTALYSIDLTISFTIESVSGATIEAKQTVVFNGSDLKWSDNIQFGNITSLSKKES